MRQNVPLVYSLGLDPCVAQATYSDLPGARIRRLRPLKAGGHARRRGHRPRLLLLDLNLAGLSAEIAAARAAWGKGIVIACLGRRQPVACVLRGSGCAEVVEIGPGFLTPFLAGGSQ